MADTTSTQPVNPPIVFIIKGDAPDVSLQVFSQTFRVHSSFLKMKSAFFCKFLDSPDKASQKSPTGSFKYEWVTKVDEDGTWHLVSSAASGLDAVADTRFQGDEAVEIEAMKILLRSIYGWRFAIQTHVLLLRATDLADYYCALPALSSGIRGALHESPAVVGGTASHPQVLIEAAFRLRCPVLYRECLIQTMGPWTDPRYKLIDNKKLRDIAQASYDKLSQMVLRAQSSIYTAKACSSQSLAREFNTAEVRFAYSSLTSFTTRTGIQLPQLYQQLHNHCRQSGASDFEDALQPLMTNNLVLKGTDSEPGVGNYSDFFLCLEISDEDLPWDLEENDW